MDKSIKKVKSLQQQELNAVKMYRGLAEKCKTDNLKQLYLTLSAEEGRHAAECRKFTGLTLKPDAIMSIGIAFVRPLGKKATLSVIAKFERVGAKLYQNISKTVPELSNIAADELRHSEMLLAMKKEL